MRLTRNWMWIIVSALWAAACIPSTALAETIELKMHHYLVESRPEAKSTQEFADRVYEKSGGRLKINVYYGGSLGLKDVDMLRILQAGTVDLAFIYNEYLTRDDPALGLLYVSGVIKEREDHLNALPALANILEDAYSKWDIRLVGGGVTPVYDVGIHCEEPINSLEGLQGKKVRVWSAHQVETFSRLGVAAQVIPQNDMYMALQTGVVDCAIYLSTIAPTVSLQEVTKYEAYLHPLGVTPQMFAISDNAWNNLTPELQQIVMEAGDYIWNKTKAEAIDPEREAAARKQREELGIDILEPFSEEDRTAFREMSRQVWKEMVEKLEDETASENHQRLLEAIDGAS